jgi:hypothetical protein
MARKQITIHKDNVRLCVVHQVYREKVRYTRMPDGELIPEKRDTLHKEMTLQKWFKRDAITSVEEYVTSQDKIAKSRSIVFDKYSGRSYMTYHSPQEIINTIYPDPKPIRGFNP